MLKTFYLLFIIGFLISCEEQEKDEAVLASISDTIPANEDLAIFSTPGSHKLNVVFRSPTKTTAKLKLYSEEGRLISQLELQVFAGINTWEVRIPGHHAGMVMIQFATAKKVKSMKIML